MDIIQSLIIDAANTARAETTVEIEPEFTQKIQWPIQCTIGPGLEGAIACESAVGYVNGAAGRLIYRGYDVFDLCAYSNYEEVSFLLLHGKLPTKSQLKKHKEKLISYRAIPQTLRQIMGLPIEITNSMAALRLATLLLRQNLTTTDIISQQNQPITSISSDEDSISMEKVPFGETHAIYEFNQDLHNEEIDNTVANINSCYHLIAALPTIVAAIHRVRCGLLPIEPDPALSHAANFLYMIRGDKPTKQEERIMDTALILHADHGINASTFATLVVASTLSDIYFSVGSGIAALNGPLHGGANAEVVAMLQEIGLSEHAEEWVENKLANNQKIPGFGHRVYKTYDPRARVLAPLAKYLARETSDHREMFRIAEKLEHKVVASLGQTKKVFPNVDFYSGLIYLSLGIPSYLFTPIFAASRAAGWTARTMEYLENNRIFRPRAVYTGAFDNKYVPIDKR